MRNSQATAIAILYERVNYKLVQHNIKCGHILHTQKYMYLKKTTCQQPALHLIKANVVVWKSRQQAYMRKFESVLHVPQAIIHCCPKCEKQINAHSREQLTESAAKRRILTCYFQSFHFKRRIRHCPRGEGQINRILCLYRYNR